MITPDMPRLAVLIPIFRHSSLVIETVESVLAQQTDFGVRILLVNDGCPFVETDEVCRDYALAYPERITYLRKPNGGLSDARNFGIRHVLEHLPSVEAIYLMDADNLLRAGAMRRAFAELDAHPDVDWIYPNIDMFGMAQRYDYGGPYSMLVHTAMNTCEAGSLIRRRVFEAGVMFDTGFKMGWEDWDFFLSAAQAGFRGRNIEDFGFLYRKRPESMLADSERDQAALAGAMRLKHKSIMQPHAMLAFEHKEAPRYAIHLSDREVLYCVDPLAEGVQRVDYDRFESDFWRSRTAPGRYRLPPFNVAMSAVVFEGLQKIGLLRWVLWALELCLKDRPIAAVVFKLVPGDRMTVAELENTAQSGEHRSAAVLAMSPEMMLNVVDDEQSGWIDTLAQPNGQPPVKVIELGLPSSVGLSGRMNRPTAVFDFLSLIHRMRSSPWRTAGDHTWDTRAVGIPFRNREYKIVRQPFNGTPVYPRLPDGRRHIGFLLPLVEFGGVEKVALHMARALKARGFVPHAIVLEARTAHVSREWSETFESTRFLVGTPFAAWGGGAQEYCGTEVPGWAQHGPHAPALGMLHWLDVAVNFHGGAGAALMGQLKRMGVVTVDSLHLNDLTGFGRSVGNTYLGLAYEHAFDLFVPCSHQLGDWLHGMGVPQQKIVPVQNAPGFEIEAATNAQRQAARLQRGAGEPLRVLYLGRLDRQKGLDRLAQVMQRAEAKNLNIEWRVIGKAVLADGAAELDPAIAAVLEPPISRPSALAEAYGWADVVVLLSRFEGLPLTVLEGMRAGAVLVATDVGATSEVLRDGENGALLNSETAVEDCLAVLERFCADRAYLHSLSRHAFADRQGHDWLEATAELSQKLLEKLDSETTKAAATGCARQQDDHDDRPQP